MGDNHSRAHKKRLLCMRRSNILLLLLTGCYVTYLMIGSVIFMKTEAPIETELKKSLLILRNEFARKHPCVTEEALQHLIVSVVKARDQGIVVVRNITDTDSRWDLGESMFFATTLITTIGYGHLTPLSTFGKVFSIFYSVIGIPLTLILLSAHAERVMAPAILLLKFMARQLNNIMKPLYIQFIHLLVTGLLIIVFFFVIPSVIFYSLEPNWSYFDSLYFCYISLTTIGLGDLVPGETLGHEYHFLYKAGSSFYLLIGLTFIVMFLALISNISELNIGFYFSKKGDELTEDLEQMKLTSNSTEKLPRYLTTESPQQSLMANKFDSS